MRNRLLIFFTVFFVMVLSVSAFAEKFDIEHPLKNPRKYTASGKCDNCRMDRNHWARTRHEFQNSKGTFHTCSIHCVADMNVRMKENPKNVKVAEYLHPEKMLDAEEAFYVVGSTAPGTMTGKSKIAFSSKEEAGKFAAAYGGYVSDFDGALSVAGKELKSH